MYQLADSHVHLDDASFDTDRLAVIARARASGVTAQIVPAITADSWAPIEALCASHADVPGSRPNPTTTQGLRQREGRSANRRRASPRRHARASGPSAISPER